MPPILTIGHSTRPVGELIALLNQNGVELLVDVRSLPRSRTNPQFNAEALAPALAEAGIGYCHMRALGGLRHHKKGAPPSPNTLWRSAAFRNFADYAATAEFRTGLDELLRQANRQRCAIMCAEAVWWRCHRRIIADYLLAAGVPVRHIMAPGKTEPASPTPGVRPGPDGTLVYPASPNPEDPAGIPEPAAHR
jgi:uncharacterized protein (DUF488 family)